MADFAYNIAAKMLLDGDLDFDAPDDIRVMLLETDAEDRDHADLAEIITAGAVELTSTNYSRQALGSEATSQDDANDRAEFDAADATFSGVEQASAETVVAAIVYLHVDGTNANDIPIAHIDSGGFPITPNGSDITITWSAEGILQLSTT
jgi:hypothetical protein